MPELTNIDTNVSKKTRELIGILSNTGKNIGGELQKRLKTFANRCNDAVLFEDSCKLTEQAENELFSTICGIVDINSTPKFYRYTSFSSLIRTLTDEQQSMCSLVAMNDASERNYCRKYMERYQKEGYEIKGRKNGRMDDWNFEDLFKSSNNRHFYITSLMTKKNKDNLDMWRIYGDDAKGVMLEYEIRQHLINPPFFLAHISYETKKDSNGAILFIYNLMRHKFQDDSYIHLRFWNAWQHMFKPYEYHGEEEVRLLYVSKKVDKWIFNAEYSILMPIKLFGIKEGEVKATKETYPLKLTGIMLGPKMPDKETNEEMLSMLLKDKGMENIVVRRSKIDTYR